MLVLLFTLIFSFILNISSLSTNYEYYTSNGIQSGLSVDQSYFLLNGKNVSIYSGSIHYFRVPRAYWRDRLKKLKAMGANTVATYIAWNLHEPEPGHFDFGNGGSDMEDFAHLEEFIKIAQEEDLFIILRSGPYICAEYESGGLPSWLLRDKGWFDDWGKSHQTRSIEDFIDIYQTILSYPASVNIYMFIGGTNFGFLSGAGHQDSSNGSSRFSPITTSYDYDALLAENGDYTDKYYAVKDLLKKYANPNIIVPNMPELLPRVAYTSIAVTQKIGFNSFLSTLPNEERIDIVSMEQLHLNNDGGQSYGYVIYSKTNVNLPANSILKIVGRVYDTVIVIVDGKRVSPILKNKADLNNFGTWAIENSTLTLNYEKLSNVSLDLIVENWGRVNTGAYQEYKGLRQGIEINDQPVYNWKHSSLEFKKSWLNQLNNSWKNVLPVTSNLSEPKLLHATLNIAERPKDTYVHMENWTKGVVIVNNIVLGRYSRIGPQQTLYLPAPFLKQGDNDIVIFEHFRGDGKINFVTDSIYKIY